MIIYNKSFLCLSKMRLWIPRNRFTSAMSKILQSFKKCRIWSILYEYKYSYFLMELHMFLHFLHFLTVSPSHQVSFNSAWALFFPFSKDGVLSLSNFIKVQKLKESKWLRTLVNLKIGDTNVINHIYEKENHYVVYSLAIDDFWKRKGSKNNGILINDTDFWPKWYYEDYGICQVESENNTTLLFAKMK